MDTKSATAEQSHEQGTEQSQPRGYSYAAVRAGELAVVLPFRPPSERAALLARLFDAHLWDLHEEGLELEDREVSTGIWQVFEADAKSALAGEMGGAA